MSIKINGRSYPYQSSYNGLNIIEVCQLLKQPITALCFLKQCSNIARCGLCLVSVNHALKLACATKIADGDQIEIDTPEIKQAVLTKVNGLLNRHQFNCGSCSRRHNCEFLKLVITTKAKKTSQSKPHELKTLSDDRSAAIVLDQSKCLGCNRCVANCKYRTGLDCLKLIPTPINKQPGLAVCPIDPKKPLDQSKCLLCGQCILACPTGALSEKSHIDRILAAIKDQKTYVVCAIAPSVRTALGEEFGFPYGTDVIKKIYTALKQIGIDQVYDLNFAADLTIFEEAFEFVNRLGINIEPLLKKLNLKRDHPNVVHHHPLPLITSCCPAWMRLANHTYPEWIEHISSTKSPQSIYGSMIKEFLPKTNPKLKKASIFTINIVPCTAKKYEAILPVNQGNVDAVLTTRELAALIRLHKIDFAKLPDGKADQVMGPFSSAAALFGTSGGVMVSVLKFLAKLIDNKDLNIKFNSLLNFDDIKKATVKIANKTIKIAIINGAANVAVFKNKFDFKSFHFIEVMSCKNGCINGGGQPIIPANTLNQTNDILCKRSSVLVNNQKHNKMATTVQNASMLEMYRILKMVPNDEYAYRIAHNTTNKQKG